MRNIALPDSHPQHLLKLIFFWANFVAISTTFSSALNNSYVLKELFDEESRFKDYLIYIILFTLAISNCLSKAMSVNPSRTVDEIWLAMTKQATLSPLNKKINWLMTSILIFSAVLQGAYLFYQSNRNNVSSLRDSENHDKATVHIDEIMIGTILCMIAVAEAFYRFEFEYRPTQRLTEAVVKATQSLNNFLKPPQINVCSITEIMRQISTNTLYHYSIYFTQAKSFKPIDTSNNPLLYYSFALLSTIPYLSSRMLTTCNIYAQPQSNILISNSGEASPYNLSTLFANKRALLLTLIRSICYGAVVKFISGNNLLGTMIGIGLFIAGCLAQFCAAAKSARSAITSQEAIGERNLTIAYESETLKRARKFDEIADSITIPTTLSTIVNCNLALTFVARFLNIYSFCHFIINRSAGLNLSAIQSLILASAIATDVLNTDYVLTESSIDKTLRDTAVSYQLVKTADRKDSNNGSWANFFKTPSHQLLRAYYRASPYKHEVYDSNELHNEVTIQRLKGGPSRA